MNNERDGLLDEINETPIDEENNFKDELPPMLNVLTILTFIGSGLTLLSNLYSFLTISSTRAQMELAMEQIDDNGGTGSELADNFISGAMETLEYGPVLYSTGICVAILCIIGAYLMRQFKKSGYYLYVVACLIGVAVPIYFLGLGLMGAMVLIGGFISILFIILYGVNLKHLK